MLIVLCEWAKGERERERLFVSRCNLFAVFSFDVNINNNNERYLSRLIVASSFLEEQLATGDNTMILQAETETHD